MLCYSEWEREVNRRHLALTGIALLLSLINMGHVLAHTALVMASPAAGSTVTEFPEAITLEFNEPLLVIGTSKTNFFDLTGPDGFKVELEDLPVDGARLSARITQGDLAPGDYVISYRVVAEDGHVLRGEFTFNYQPMAIEARGTLEGSEASTDGEASSPTDNNEAVLVLSLLILITAFTAVGIFLRAGRNSN